MKQVFGYTPANPDEGMVGFVAASIDDDGNVELTVRCHGALRPEQGFMRLPANEARKLANAISPREAAAD